MFNEDIGHTREGSSGCESVMGNVETANGEGREERERRCACS
jgi:hypothetical protein